MVTGMRMKPKNLRAVYAYVGNQFICAFELPCISYSDEMVVVFFSKKEAKPQINFYTRLSLLAHLCIGSNKAIARQNI
mgnify:CR=1 FL=1